MNRFLLFALFSLLFAATAQAQFEAKAINTNPLYPRLPNPNPLQQPPLQTAFPGVTNYPSLANPPLSNPQFASMGQVTGSVGPVKLADGVLASAVHADRFPSTANNTIVLQRSSFGSAFASGVPRYFLGDQITPPTTQADPNLVADASYWRPEPLRPNEALSAPLLSPSGSVIPIGTAFIAAGTTENYYWSKHAEKVFATQPGRVTITWITRITEGGQYKSKQETFAVSSATTAPVRTIFWTERTFDGPRVAIRDARITTVNPIYYSTVPQSVPAEVVLPGIPAVPLSDPGVILKTIWFERIAGEGVIRAYNVEGRIFIEYLGDVRAGNDVYEFLGSDVVDIVRVPEPNRVVVNLGQEIKPSDGDPTLFPSPKLALNAGPPWYGTTARPDGTQVFHAERETGPPNVPENGEPSTGDDAYNKVVFYWLKEGNFGIRWPKFQDRYWQRWPLNVGDYAHNTVPGTGSTTDTAVQFTGGLLPTLVFQDDEAQEESRLDINTQRLLVNVPIDGLNRTLLKFTANGKVWYIPVFTQSSTRAGYLEGNGDPSQFAATATVGARIDPPADFTPPGGGQTVHYEPGGYISSGTCYNPLAYVNPISFGVENAAAGAIIPVNTVPTNNLEIWWFRKITPPSDDFQPFYLPAKVGRYTVTYPLSTTPQIVIAQGVGTDDLPAWEAAGSVYVQNNANGIGYNPNEEHAFMLGTRAYALRDDLNIGTAQVPQQSEPFVLLSYTDPVDGRPNMHAYKVVREFDPDGDRADPDDILFSYNATAGTLLNAPYPLPLMPLPMVSGISKNLEVTPANEDTAPNAAAPSIYGTFTMKDRKGFHWVYRGPHDGVSTAKKISMQYYYVSREKFFVPGTGTNRGELPVGTILPFLRRLDNLGVPEGDPVAGTPLTVEFKPKWPDSAPELRVGETLTLPKFGLPQVRGQISAEVFYEQSNALISAKPSVTLHDPTREKTFALGTNAADLQALPKAIATTSYLGKTYFQRLPPDLQERLYFDPLRGPKGTLVLKGEFHDEIAGEDYLHLNLLTAAQEATLKGLVTEEPDKAKWEAAVNALNTKVQTFQENPARKGTYIADTTKDAIVGKNELAKITSAETAVDSYALTATGEGAGWVTLVFGNGSAFTPVGDPVQVKVIKVAPQLYTGDLKVLMSKNPLDEQVTLRHSGDFAGRPEDYEFEWRWAPGAASAPATYTQSWSQRLGATNNGWKLVRNPAAALPADADYTGTTLTFPRTEAIRDTSNIADSGFPGLVLKSTATTSLDFTSNVPGEIVFSATLGSLDGFVLYVNGVAALAHQAPAPFINSDAASGIVPGALSKQFSVSRNYFAKGPNKVEVALFTGADANATSSLDFRLDVTVETDVVASTFQAVNDTQGKNTNTALVGGDTSLPFGGPTFVLNDRWFTMRYRPKTGVTNVAGTGYSRWMPPQFVEGWIKRVLREINPFEQRVKDMFNNAISTDTSVLTQAGTKWEGDVALTLDNVEDVGLIAIYETVLNRAKSMSIDANTNDPDTNNALMLAAGYLSDLYALLGNEALADAANPTISTDDEDSATEINTSRYSFENQVASSLDEELALLRGRDATSTAVNVAPVYNRLYWNYTGGINAGEVLYATNYNIKEKAGSSTSNGVIDAADAYRMFPQGHGDAYGHYLTAIKGYYRLLASPNFNWQRRAEAVTVLGQPVTVDYVDERKFAGNAVLIARTAEQVAALTHRQQYQDNPATGWTQYKDTISGRNWGLDDWTSRSTQGAYYHWAVANAMLPDVDRFNTGVEKIDRTTVPELNELATSISTLQGTADSASSRLNPLGLSPGAIPFDLDPAYLIIGSGIQGKGHFEQIYDRSLRALVNAAGSFNQAARMTRLLRSQENQVDDYNTAIVDQERAYRNELIEIFGRPYSGEIGPGKAFAQDYYGPDLDHWFVVDRPFASTPEAMVDTISSDSAKLRIRIPDARDDFTYDTIADIQKTRETDTKEVEVTVYPNQFIQYSDVFMTGMDTRPETGELQSALMESHRAYLDLKDALYNVTILERRFKREGGLFLENLEAHESELLNRDAHLAASVIRETLQVALEGIAGGFSWQAEAYDHIKESVVDHIPTVVGLASDAFSTIRGAASAVGGATVVASNALALLNNTLARATDIIQTGADLGLERNLAAIGFSLEERQQAYEFEQLYRDLSSQKSALAQPAAAYQLANERVRNLLQRGLRVLEERETFRKRAAAVIQGYRTKDVTFRVFRNESLEQYRSLFDLASRYTYLAAKSYDYETGLLGTTEGEALISGIVASRSLGDVRDGTVQSTVSSLGDSGLAGTMAKLNADFAVAEGRLGINNPDIYNTIFSLRGELFRILDDPGQTSDDEAWQQTLEQHFKANVMADADVTLWCRNIAKPNGTPVPGIIIPFSTTIQHGLNFFGLPLAAGDSAYTPSSYATKINSVGIALPGYIGMDEYATGNPTSGTPALNNPNALSATPYVYLIPVGTDYMLAPPLGDTNTIRAWQVQDQALPLPFNLGNSAFNTTQFFNAAGTLNEQPWVMRKHQAFRPVADPSILLGGAPAEFTNTRLVARSAWNSGWKIVIPAYTLLNNEQEGINRFARTIRDIRLFLRTYSHSGN
jgi:hypothetical protein